MTTSEEWVEKLINFEGVRLKTYLDIAGVPTIGVGHTGKDVKIGMTITMEEARELLKRDLAAAENYVNAFNGVLNNRLNQNQFDALVDIVYNCGSGSIKVGTTIRRELLKSLSNQPSICHAFMLWCKARNPKTNKLEVVKGLERRRATECAWFFYGKNYESEFKKRGIVDLIQWARG